MTDWRTLPVTREVIYATSYDVKKAGVDSSGRVVVNPGWALSCGALELAYATFHEHYHAASQDYADEAAADRYAGRCLRAKGASLESSISAAKRASARVNAAALVAEGWEVGQ